MNESQCMARLLASAVHDMRNVLAVIRESAGLAQDLAALAAREGGAARHERLATALSEVQRAVVQGAALAEGMDHMAQAGGKRGQRRPLRSGAGLPHLLPVGGAARASRADQTGVPRNGRACVGSGACSGRVARAVGSF